MGTAVLTSVVTAEDMSVVGFLKKKPVSTRSFHEMTNSKKIGIVEKRYKLFDNSLIPWLVGHHSCPDQCLLKMTELARQLKGRSQSGTLGQMTFIENIAVLRNRGP